MKHFRLQRKHSLLVNMSLAAALGAVLSTPNLGCAPDGGLPDDYYGDARGGRGQGGKRASGGTFAKGAEGGRTNSSGGTNGTGGGDESGGSSNTGSTSSTGGSDAGGDGGTSNDGGAESGGSSNAGSGGSSNAGRGGTANGGRGGTGGGSGGSGGTGGSKPVEQKFDVTFYVVSDTHADPPGINDRGLRATARVINAIGGVANWPSNINGKTTNFIGGKIAKPRGVVFTGDLTGWGNAPEEIPVFRRFFEQGNSGDSIHYPGYIGLGNHDTASAHRVDPEASNFRNQYWAWVDSRHKGSGAPVPTREFDSGSHAYSWDWDRVHLIQAHHAPGTNDNGLPSSLSFINNDLKKHAADGRPVFLFHHYGMDPFGSQDRWWTAQQRAAYRDTLRPYKVSAIIAGHSHGAMQYTWEGIRAYQVNNAKEEIGTGNNDGNGSFAIVRITESRLNIVTCRWKDDQGNYELIEPFMSGPAVQ